MVSQALVKECHTPDSPRVVGLFYIRPVRFFLRCIFPNKIKNVATCVRYVDANLAYASMVCRTRQQFIAITVLL